MTRLSRLPQRAPTAALIGSSLVLGAVVTLAAVQVFASPGPAVGDTCEHEPGQPAGMDEPFAFASRSGGEHPPRAALDGDFETWWGAESQPVQWIEVGLPVVTRVAELRLSTSQTPAGRTEHRVYGRVDLDHELALLHTFRGNTSDGDVLLVTPTDPWPPVCLLRIETVESPSWVSWREIEVVASDRGLPPAR